MSENTKLPEEKRKRSKRLKVLAAIVPALLLTIAIPKIMYNTSDKDDTSISDGYRSDAPEIDPNAGEYVDQQEEDNESDGIAVPGWNSLNIPKTKRKRQLIFIIPKKMKDGIR